MLEGGGGGGGGGAEVYVVMVVVLVLVVVVVMVASLMLSYSISPENGGRKCASTCEYWLKVSRSLRALCLWGGRGDEGIGGGGAAGVAMV